MATLDFSIASISDNVVEIIASNGDVNCGGSDLDKIVSDYIVSEFKAKEGVDLSNDPMAMQRIIEAAEKAKIDLSSQASTDINLPYITAVDGVPKHLVISLTRAKFEQLIDGEISKVIRIGKETLSIPGFPAKDLTGILTVGGSTRIPKVQEELIKAFGDKLIKNFNPDEIVALGAAVQGSIIAGENTDVLLLDVIPLSLGIDTMGGVMATVVRDNTTIPCKRSQVFTTAENNQSSVTIVVAQGNRPMTKDNKQIGIFTLDGIAPAPRGIPQIEVTFDIDTNGMLSVSAKDMGTGKEQHITIESKSSITDEEIERMKKDAELHAEEDRKAKETAEELNSSDAYAYQVEKTISELGDKITDEQKNSINGLVESIRAAVKEQNAEKAKEARTALESAWNPIVEEMYKSSQPNDSSTQQNPFSEGNPFTNNPSDNPFANN